MPQDRLKPISLYGVHPLDAMAALLRVPPVPKGKAATAKRRPTRAKKKRAKRES
jgi:hypothetical protein